MYGGLSTNIVFSVSILTQHWEVNKGAQSAAKSVYCVDVVESRAISDWNNVCYGHLTWNDSKLWMKSCFLYVVVWRWVTSMILILICSYSMCEQLKEQMCFRCLDNTASVSCVFEMCPHPFYFRNSYASSYPSNVFDILCHCVLFSDWHSQAI